MSTKSNKVALCGYYGYGNFGDDLMAVLLGLSLRESGIDFTIYRLRPEDAAPFGFKTADSANELLSDARFLIWGGGGLLVPWSPFLYGILYPGVSGRYDGLVKMAVNLGLKFMAVSVGGTGEAVSPLTPDYKQAFINAAEFVSARNPQDLKLLQNAGVPCDYYPDIIWQTADRFPAGPGNQGRKRIGIDLYFSNLVRGRALNVVPLIWKIARMHPEWEFILMDSTNRRARPYRGLGRIVRGPNVRSYQFSDIGADLEFLSSLDLLVSSRLHTPMICIGYGIPALSIFGEKKTALMMRNLGLSDCCVNRRQMARLASLFTGKDRLSAFLEQYRFPDVSSLRSQSYGHRQRLDKLLS